MKCKKCGSETKQYKIGKTESGSQRYLCWMCKHKYTPEKKAWRYGEDVRKKAIQMYVDGISFRKIARHLGVHHQSIVNWVNAYANQLPESPVPDKVEHAEMDELFTFVGTKKTKSTSSHL
jgi:transposase